VTVVYRKLVLFEFEGIVTDGAIIPLNFQQKVIICGGQPEPIKPVYVRLAWTAQEIALTPMNNKIFLEKFSTADGAGVNHIKTPVGRTGAGP
jgi:hypothetical protein